MQREQRPQQEQPTVKVHPTAELGMWIEELSGKVALLCKPNVSDSWKRRLVEAGVPGDRISVLDPDFFKPGGDHFMVVADQANLKTLQDIQREEGSKVSCVMALEAGEYKRMTHDKRKATGKYALINQYALIHDGMAADRVTQILTDEVIKLMDNLPETM